MSLRPQKDDDAIWNTLAAEERQQNDILAVITPQLSENLGRIHRLAPSLPNGVKLSAAKAELTDEQIIEIARTATKYQDDLAEKKKKKRNIFGWAYDQVKTASRYSFAALQFPIDMIDNTVSQFTDGDPSVSGMFISTELGSLIAGNDEAGDGFFVGGRAKELQAERARKYRGEINGKAFTLGRGLASTFLPEDTFAYRIVSGAIDAAKNIAVPAVPGAKQIGSALRTAQAAGKGGKTVDVLADATRFVGRGSKEIGLTDLNKIDLGIVNDAVDYEKANRFFRTRLGQRVVERTAETMEPAEIRRLWGGKLDAQTIVELADAANPTDVMRVLSAEGRLGGQVVSTTGLKGTKRFYRSLAQRDKLVAEIPFGEGVSRLYAKLPRHSLDFADAESPRDQIKMMDTLDRTLDMFKVGSKGRIAEVINGEEVITEVAADPQLRSKLMNKAIRLLAEKDDYLIDQFYDELENVFKESMVLNGANRNIVDALYSSLKENLEKNAVRQEDALGQAEDFNAAAKFTGQEDVVIRGGLHLSSELATREFPIPDPVKLRRLTSNMNWIFGKGINGIWAKTDPNLKDLASAGELRLPFAAVANFQEKIWRKIITLTPGNFLRNIVDSQLSIALSNREEAISLFRHPFQWYEFVKKNQGLGDILGQSFDEASRLETINDAAKNYRTATMDDVNSFWQDPVEPTRRAKRLGIFKGQERIPGEISVDVARAHGDEIGKLNADWVARSMAQGYSTDEIFSIIRAKNTDPVVGILARSKNLNLENLSDAQRQNLLEEAQIIKKNADDWYRAMKSSYKNTPMMNVKTREPLYQKVDLDEDQNLMIHIDATFQRLRTQTGDNQELMNAVGKGRMASIEVSNDRIIGVGDAKPGERVRFTAFDTRTKKGIEQDGTVISYNPDTGVYTLEPFAFSGSGESSVLFEQLLKSEKIYNDPAMPKRVVGEIRDPQTPEAQSMMQSMTLLVRRFHGFLHDKPVGTLERSPIFRNLYYSWIEKLAISMDQSGIAAIIDDVTKAAAREGVSPEKYLKPDLWNKLNDLNDNPNKLYGSLTREEVSSFASGNALDEIEKMTYNAIERRNVTDIMRVISPFAQQQAEFLARMFRSVSSPIAAGQLGYLPNPVSMRKLQLVVEGGRDADPDGDGRGFFYKNPENGQWSFTFPLTGELTKLATGIEAGLTLPLRGVVLGLDYRPGLGPFATVAASKLLADTPGYDSIRKFLLPYGERSDIVGTVVPSYLQKIYDGITGNTDGRFFANTYVETMQALAATGKYDLSLPEEKDRMLNDARNKARILVMLRGITQFTGPAAGDFEYKIPTDQGDIYANGLAYALRNLQNINYDTATLRFIEIFGEDAFAYLSNKTVSEVGGLESSQEFYDFQRNNGGLFRQYKEVAGYFGPKGTEFSFEAYVGQLNKGQRRRLTAEEVLDASQRAIGLAYYRDMRANFGPTVNQEQRAYLANYKEEIKKQYPGFANMQYDPQALTRKVDLLFQAAKRDDLVENPAAQALKFYESVRADALQEASNRGFSTLKSEKLNDLKEYLDSYAQALIEKYPEFARVYDRVLYQEIE